MPRSRPARRRGHRRAPPAAAATATPRRRRRGPLSPLELRILGLARELADIAGTPADPRARRDRALARLADAFESSGPLADPLLAAWQRARSDETLALSLAWGREQLRASLQEILDAGVAAGLLRKAPPPAELAWVLLAACEALLREAPGGGIVSTPELLRTLGRITEP
jgi:hypothetical protein